MWFVLAVAHIVAGDFHLVLFWCEGLWVNNLRSLFCQFDRLQLLHIHTNLSYRFLYFLLTIG